MRAYAKVSPVFWTRGSGKRLRGDGVAQAVAFHLATGPQANMVGLYHVALPTIAHETGHPEAEVRKALARLAEVGFAYYDEEAEIAFVPNALEIEVGIGKALKAGDRRRAGILAQVEAVGNHRFVALFWERYGEAKATAAEAGDSADVGPGAARIGGGRQVMELRGLLDKDAPDTWVDDMGVVRRTPRTKGRLKHGKYPGHRALREYVIRRDGGKCRVCGSTEMLVADHIISRRNGGAHHPDNLQCLCDRCNAAKAGRVDAKGPPR